MPLPPKVEDIESVDENLRDFYVESDDGYVLDVEGGFPDVAGLKSALQKERQAVKEYKQKLRNYADIDPEKYQELLEKAEQFEKQTPPEEVIESEVQKRLQRFTEENKRKLSEYEQMVAERDKRLGELLIGDSVSKAAAEAGAVDTALEDIKLRASMLFKVVDGEVKAVDKDGDVVYGKDGVSPLTISEWLEDLRSNAPHLFKGNSGGGSAGGASGNSGGTATKVRARSELKTPAEKSAFIEEHGMEAYLKLPTSLNS